MDGDWVGLVEKSDWEEGVEGAVRGCYGEIVGSGEVAGGCGVMTAGGMRA